MVDTNSKCKEIRREAFEYIHKLVTQLEIDNWNKCHDENEFDKGKSRAYREVVRILTNELNKY